MRLPAAKTSTSEYLQDTLYDPMQRAHNPLIRTSL